MTNDEILGIFFLECEEALAAAETALDLCRSGTHDSETVNAIFRAVHSIKGGAGAFGFSALQHFTHGFETLLSEIRDGTIAVTSPLVDLMLRALDMLTDHVSAARDSLAAPNDATIVAQLAAAQSGAGISSSTDVEVVSESGEASIETDDLDFDLDAMLGDIAAEVSPDQLSRPLFVKPRAAALANGGEPILLLRELVRLGGECAEVDFSAVPLLDTFDVGEAYLAWQFALPDTVPDDAILEIFDFVGDDCEIRFGAVTDNSCVQHHKTTEDGKIPKAAPPLQPHTAARTKPLAPVPASVAAPGASIRIDLVKLDRLIDAVGELVIAQAMMAQRLSGHGLSGIEELAMLDGLTRDIQDSAMGIRAQPIGSVFSRVPRILRELEGTTGKRVELEVSGEATELDKTVIERLGEPLTHLIRNAVDHGIEREAERIAAGKTAHGTLRLSAEHRSGRIVIKVADDGKGIDRVRVLSKAIERGLVPADVVLSDEEIDNLIFAPGFSTAQSVSNISGRGVGMDVVRQNVKELGGRISIVSQPGQGSVFTLALPLTLAISDGMIVSVGDQTLVVPLAHVVESLRPDPGQIQQLGSGRKMLNVRGKFIPILPIAQSVGAANAVGNPCEAVLIVVDTEIAGQAALQVDTIRDQRQFVIKNLDTHYRAVDGVAGATILGDGRVALIVDVDAMVNNVVAPPVKAAA